MLLAGLGVGRLCGDRVRPRCTSSRVLGGGLHTLPALGVALEDVQVEIAREELAVERARERVLVRDQ